MSGENANDRAVSETTGRRRSSIGRLGLLVTGFLLVAGLLVYFAPSIVASTSLRQRIGPMILPQFDGQISIGSASLGWFSPVVLRDVKLADKSGQPLLDADSITSEQTLLSIISDQQHLGTFHIERPVLHAELRTDGSNVEDFVAQIMETSSDAWFDIVVIIADGRINATDSVTGQQWTIDKVNATLDLPTFSGTKMTGRVRGQFTSSDRVGSFESDATWQLAAAQNFSQLGEGTVSLRGESLPLDTLAFLLRRFEADVRPAGLLATTANYSWASDGAKQSVELKEFSIRGLRVRANEWLGDDELALDFIQSDGTLTVEGDRLHVRNFKLTSDLGKFTVDGSASVDQLKVAALNNVLQQEDYRVDGEVDLAKLAELLPQTLHVRDDVRIKSGKASVTLYSRVEGDRRRWVGNVQTSNLAAQSGDQQISWEQPIVITFTAANSPDGPIIETLSCQSSFLKASGQGTLANGSLKAEADLDRLTAELDQFLDLSRYKLAGRMNATANWQRHDASLLTAEANAKIENFDFVWPGARPWREQRLDVNASAVGIADQRGVQRINSGKLSLVAGGDRFDLELVQPIDSPSIESAFPVRGQLTGELATWLPRLQAFIPLAGWQIDGAIQVSGEGVASTDRLDVTASSFNGNDLRVQGNGVAINEPDIRGEAAGSIDVKSGRLQLKSANAASSAISLRADDMVIEPQDGGVKVSGDVAYRGDLARLAVWFADPQRPMQQQVSGAIVGNATLKYDGGITHAKWNADVDNFALARRAEPVRRKITPASSNNAVWQTIWQEKKLTIGGEGQYDLEKDSAQLSSLAVQSETLATTANGTIHKPFTQPNVDLKGQITYDLKNVADRLRPYIGSEIQFAGRDTRPFSIKGPLITSDVQADDSARTRPETTVALLVPRELTAQASVGWTSGSAHGFQVGTGECNAQLTDGVIRIAPLDVPVSEGRLKAAPQIMLSSSPVMLLEKGPLVEQVRISPEMCQSWLKYVAPLLAEATRAEGRFSVELAGAKVPLMDPAKGDMQGIMQIHQAQIGPGPLGQQVLWIARQVKAIVEQRPLDSQTADRSFGGLTVPTQNIEFRMVDGRVHHRELKMQVKDVVVVTRGSVGVDQSLDLVAAVPIREQWVADRRFVSALRGQVVEVPIKGTLSKPAVDERAIADLSRKLITNSAGRLLEDEVLKGLDRLFGPKN